MSNAGLLSFPLLGTVTDADGNPHPAYHDGAKWNPIGEIQLGYAEINADIVVPAGPAAPICSVPVSFAGVGHTCQVLIDIPEIDFTSTSGGECVVQVTLAGTTYIIGHVHTDRSVGWPMRSARRLPIPGAGTYSFDCACDALSGGVTLHADDDVSYGPITATVTVVG